MSPLAEALLAAQRRSLATLEKAYVAGFEIRPQGMGFRGRTRAPTPYSFYVLDRAYCHRVVAAFDAHGSAAVHGGSQRRKRLAEERCAELNRVHA